MLTASIDSCKRLFVEKAYQTMLCRYLLHYFHSKLIVIGCNIGCGIDGGKLVLCRSYFVMLCFCKNPQLPEFFIQLIHIGGYSRLNYAKIMIIHLLPLWRLRAEKGTPCKTDILSLLIHFLCNKEILLLRTDRGADAFHILISKKMEDTHSLSV